MNTDLFESGFNYKSLYSEYLVFPKISIYSNNNNIYMGFDYYDDEFEGKAPYCNVTVNIGKLPYLHAAIDTNNNGDNIIKFLEDNGFGEMTGKYVSSGFCDFPIIKFNEEILFKIDPFVMEEYSKYNKESLKDQINNSEKESTKIIDLKENGKNIFDDLFR